MGCKKGRPNRAKVTEEANDKAPASFAALPGLKNPDSRTSWTLFMYF